MDDNRLPKRCYKMLYRQDNIGRKNWASQIKTILYKIGFGISWVAQEVGDINIFINQVKQRLIDIEQQDWHIEILKYSKLRTLVEFKTLLNPERYIHEVNILNHRTALTRLRISAHNLAIETDRQLKIDAELRVCKYCHAIGENYVEDEYHFLLICPLYDHIRFNLLPLNIILFPTTENFVKLMKTEDCETMNKLANYCYLAFKCRESNEYFNRQ